MYVLEELLLADSLEKVIRMEVYLNDVEIQASEDEIKIIKFYKNVIKTIKNQLEKSADRLKKYHGGKITEEASSNCINICLNSSFAIRSIHDEFLSYLPSLKTRAETYIFLKNLLQQVSEETGDIKPAIVLTDIYNYEERNISQILKDKGIIKGEIEEQIIIGLPKIEKDNPLMWTILIHEIGHTLAEKHSKNLSKIIEKFIIDKKIDINHLYILKNWINEIISDILSLQIMGPSYLCSFIFFNLIISDLDEFSKSHPSPRYRILILMSRLEKRGFELGCINELYDVINKRQSMNLISGDDSCPICEKEYDPMSDMEVIKKEFCQLIEESINIIDEIKIVPYTPNKLSDCKKLVNNLNNSIPISSSRKVDDKELKEIMGKFFALSNNEKNNGIYALLEQFEDKPNSISDIINAGWLHKINNSHSEFIKVFFENNEKDNNTFDDKYENYKKYLIKNDELLLKSLEIVDMHLLLEFGRGLL